MILLIGDYSSVHYELSKALKCKGVEVILISDGDAYKKIKCDLTAPTINKIKNKWLNRLFSLLRFTGFFGFFNYLKLKKKIKKMKKVDAAQIINPVAIPALGAIGNLLLIRYLRKNTSMLSLCALGDDCTWVSACLKGQYKYSPMDRLKKGGVMRIFSYLYSIKYIYSPLYFLLDKYARSQADIIVPGLIDYELAYENESKLLQKRALPIADEYFKRPNNSVYPLNIFHAWQKGKDLRKGNDILDKVIQRYIKEHNNLKINYEVISDLTYDEYLLKYKDADIILDQIFSYDCGVTGVLGMAGGKVVFSGFEVGHFKFGINATPDEEKLYSDFVKLINSLEMVDTIKKNAYEYACLNHKASIVADEYMRAWNLIK